MGGQAPEGASSRRRALVRWRWRRLDDGGGGGSAVEVVVVVFVVKGTIRQNSRMFVSSRLPAIVQHRIDGTPWRC